LVLGSCIFFLIPAAKHINLLAHFLDVSYIFLNLLYENYLTECGCLFAIAFDIFSDLSYGKRKRLDDF
jgi:hypothetical protein